MTNNSTYKQTNIVLSFHGCFEICQAPSVTLIIFVVVVERHIFSTIFNSSVFCTDPPICRCDDCNQLKGDRLAHQQFYFAWLQVRDLSGLFVLNKLVKVRLG
jgi:hypothetical protein